jgi:D-alanine-D-alanine ligase
MTKKLKIAILFGGKSTEHEVALQSAKNVINALDKGLDNFRVDFV